MRQLRQLRYREQADGMECPILAYGPLDGLKYALKHTLLLPRE